MSTRTTESAIALRLVGAMETPALDALRRVEWVEVVTRVGVGVEWVEVVASVGEGSSKPSKLFLEATTCTSDIIIEVAI